MNIQDKHIASKTRVGSLHGKPVVRLVTNGGLVLIGCTKNDGKTEILGSGPHRAVSMYIAEHKEPEIVWSELSKSDSLDLASILSVVPRYQDLTEQLNALMNRE